MLELQASIARLFIALILRLTGSGKQNKQCHRVCVTVCQTTPIDQPLTTVENQNSFIFLPLFPDLPLKILIPQPNSDTRTRFSF